MIRLSFFATLLFASLGLTGCEELGLDRMPNATGSESDIIVLADTTLFAGPAGDGVRETIGAPIITLPAPESAFRMRNQSIHPNLIRELRRQRHLMFMATLDEQSDYGDFVRARIGEEAREAIRQGGNGVFIREDLWARGQVVIYATGATPEDIARSLEARRDTLVQVLNRNARRAVTASIFDRGRQELVEDTLMNRHDFAVNVQVDFAFAQDTTFRTREGRPAGFVRMRRLLSDTWRDFFVYYEDGVIPGLRPDSAETVDRINELMETYVVGSRDDSFVQINPRRPMTTRRVDLAGRQALEIRGLWTMTNDFMGGPYLVYAFYDEAQNRSYIFYGMVFAPRPRYSKRDFLRQVEVIAHTFRTSDDDAPPPLATR
ncbi:DUF4837 family protein [soil metagenome]